MMSAMNVPNAHLVRSNSAKVSEKSGEGTEKVRRGMGARFQSSVFRVQSGRAVEVGRPLADLPDHDRPALYSALWLLAFRQRELDL